MIVQKGLIAEKNKHQLMSTPTRQADLKQRKINCDIYGQLLIQFIVITSFKLMINWNAVQFDTESITHACNLLSHHQIASPMKENQRADTNLSSITQKRKIKCPPSRLQKEAKMAQRDSLQAEKQRKLSMQEQPTFMVPYLLVRPPQQPPYHQVVHHIDRSPRVEQAVISEPLRPRRVISLMNPPETPQSEKKVQFLTLQVPELSSEESEEQVRSRRASKLSNAKSFCSLEMETVKSIVDTTADTPMMERMEESQIQMDFFSSKVGDSPRHTDSRRVVHMEESISLRLSLRR